MAKEKKPGFWREFLKLDNSTVNTPYAAMLIAFILATPVVMLAMGCIVHHIFLKGKNLDSPTVHLLIALLTAATGGIVGAGVSSVTKIKTFIGGGASGVVPPIPARKGKVDSPEEGET